MKQCYNNNNATIKKQSNKIIVQKHLYFKIIFTDIFGNALIKLK